MTGEPLDRQNQEQREYWNGKAGTQWVEQNNQMDNSLRPIGKLAMDAAQVQPGEFVLDIGCGCGDTSLQLAQLSGETGKVLGVDISAPMLDLAQQKKGELPAALAATVAFAEGDAASYAFGAQQFDLVFSRFGVMFFDDPVLAFTNIRGALKPGGRLAFICWAPVQHNQWVMVPLAAALAHIDPPQPGDPHAPGPFSFADVEHTRGVLGAAGFQNIDLAPVSPTMRFGEGTPRDQIANFFMDIGPVSRALAEGTPELKEAVRASITEAIMPFYDGTGVNLEGSCWVVTASN